MGKLRQKKYVLPGHIFILLIVLFLGLMPALKIVTIIVIVFLFFAGRYFIKNNISSRQQRQSTLAASLKLIFYLPVFLQGLFLVWICITHIFITGWNFFYLFSSISFKEINFNSLSVIFSASLLLGVNVILAKITRENTAAAIRFPVLLLYAVYSATVVFIIYQNRLFAISYGSSLADIFFFNSKAVIVISLISVAGLTVCMFNKKLSSAPLLRYLLLPVKISWLYTFCAVAAALVFFIPFLLCRILF